MEQTIELMRKRHAYFTKLIEERNIHTAREFYAELHELFAMFGVDVYLNEAEMECTIAITCEDYDYEDYTVVDGKDGGLAEIKVTVECKHPTYMYNTVVDVFADSPWENQVTSGYTAIDALIGGWGKSSLSLLVGRPTMGKSTLCYNMVLNIGLQGIPVALFSLSESATQIADRLLSNISLIPSEILKKGSLKKRQWAILKRNVAKLKDAPIYIDDTPAITPSMVYSKICKLKMEHGIKIAFIDFLQLMNNRDKGVEVESRDKEVEDILKELNNIALRCQIPIVVVRMMSKMLNAGETYRPDLSALSEAELTIPSAICFLYRPDFYVRRELKGKREEIVDLIVAKSSNGKNGTVHLKFFPDFCRFEPFNVE